MFLNDGVLVLFNAHHTNAPSEARDPKPKIKNQQTPRPRRARIFPRRALHTPTTTTAAQERVTHCDDLTFCKNQTVFFTHTKLERKMLTTHQRGQELLYRYAPKAPKMISESSLDYSSIEF